MNYCDLAPSYIRAIAPYQPGKPISELERELGITGIVKLASNENPLGCQPGCYGRHAGGDQDDRAVSRWQRL